MVTAIVLAGGASSRMGRDKLSLPFGDGSVMARVIDAVRTVAGNVIICGTPHQVPDGVRVLADIHPGRGPLVALLDAVADVPSDVVLVVAGDMPLVRAQLLSLVLRELSGHDACVPRVGGILVPTCAAYRRRRVLDAAPALGATGRTSLHALVASLDVRVLEEDTLRTADPHLLSFTPCNTPDDYRRALARAGGQPSDRRV